MKLNDIKPKTQGLIRGRTCAGIAAFAMLSAISADALDFDLSGNFNVDNNIAFFNFTVGGAGGDVTIFSSSWDDGGFDPILSLWDSSGEMLAEQDDGGAVGSTVSNGISYDYGEWDSHFSIYLTAGDYTATIAQYDNFALGAYLSDGFTHDGNPTFTQAFGSEPYFNGIDEARTGYYEYHILGVASASHVPPSAAGVPDGGHTLMLASLSLLGMVGLTRLRKIGLI